MKIALSFFVFSLLFFQMSFASDWSIQDLDTGKSTGKTSVSYCQDNNERDWSNLTYGNYCIAGDIKKAYKEIKLEDGCKTKVNKVGISEKGIRVSVEGPTCVEYEHEEDGNCLRTENQKREETLLACNPSEKFFSERESQTVPFQKDVVSIRDYDKISEIYYSGDAHIKLTRRMGWLTLRLNGFKFGNNLEIQTDPREIVLLLNPNLKWDSKRSLSLHVIQNDVFGSFVNGSCSAELSKDSQSYSLTCADAGSYIRIPGLPLWTLAQDEDVKPISSFSKKNNFRVLNVKNRKELKKYEDYTSLSALWTYLSEENFSDYCVSGDLNDAFETLRVYRGEMGDRILNGNGQVYAHGIQFETERKKCAVAEVSTSADSTTCPNDNYKVLTESFFLKSCR